MHEMEKYTGQMGVLDDLEWGELVGKKWAGTEWIGRQFSYIHFDEKFRSLMKGASSQCPEWLVGVQIEIRMEVVGVGVGVGADSQQEEPERCKEHRGCI